MLIFRGWGLLALIIPLICSWTVGYFFDASYGVDAYKNHPWAMPLILVMASLPVALVGRYLARRPGRRLLDPETGEEVFIKPEHSMFWLQLQYWPVVYLAIAIWMFAANSGWIYQ